MSNPKPVFTVTRLIAQGVLAFLGVCGCISLLVVLPLLVLVTFFPDLQNPGGGEIIAVIVAVVVVGCTFALYYLILLFAIYWCLDIALVQLSHISRFLEDPQTGFLSEFTSSRVNLPTTRRVSLILTSLFLIWRLHNHPLNTNKLENNSPGEMASARWWEL